MLTQREGVVLKFLIQSKEHLNLHDIARMMDISTRTVSRYISNINKEIEKFDSEIIFEHGKGYYFFGDSGKLNSIFLGSQTTVLNEDDNEILVILAQNSEITIEEIADMTFYSDSLISKRIARAKETLALYNLQLKSKSHYGLSLTGTELDIRNLLADVAFEYHGNLVTSQRLNNLSLTEFELLRHEILSFLSQNDVIISDRDLTNLIVRVSISISRFRSGKGFSKDEIEQTVAMYHNIHLIESLLICLSNTCDFIFSDSEVQYIASFSTFINYSFNRESVISKEVLEFVEDYAYRLTEQTGINYFDNGIFINSLATHINILIHRTKFSTQVRNPMLQQIKSKYPIEMSQGIDLAKELTDHYGIDITEDEIAYLAVHIGSQNTEVQKRTRVALLCNYGIGTSQIIRERIQEEFREVEITGIYPTQYIHLALSQTPDYIVSTVEIQNYDGDIPIIVVDSLLSDDLHSEINMQIKSKVNTKSIADYFSEELFFELDFQTKDEVLREMLEKLKEARNIPDSVINSIYQREKISSTDIGNLVAIPHALVKGDFSSGIAVAKLSSAIDWGNERAQLILMIFFNERDKKSTQVFRQLYQNFKSIKAVNLFISAKTYDDFIELIRR